MRSGFFRSLWANKQAYLKEVILSILNITIWELIDTIVALSKQRKSSTFKHNPLLFTCFFQQFLSMQVLISFLFHHNQREYCLFRLLLNIFFILGGACSVTDVGWHIIRWVHESWTKTTTKSKQHVHVDQTSIWTYQPPLIWNRIPNLGPKYVWSGTSCSTNIWFDVVSKPTFYLKVELVPQKVPHFPAPW